MGLQVMGLYAMRLQLWGHRLWGYGLWAYGLWGCTPWATSVLFHSVALARGENGAMDAMMWSSRSAAAAAKPSEGRLDEAERSAKARPVRP